MLIDHLRRMAQAPQFFFFFEIEQSIIEISKITTRCLTRVCKNTKINFEPYTYGKKLVFVSKHMFLRMVNLNLGLN